MKDLFRNFIFQHLITRFLVQFVIFTLWSSVVDLCVRISMFIKTALLFVTVICCMFLSTYVEVMSERVLRKINEPCRYEVLLQAVILLALITPALSVIFGGMVSKGPALSIYESLFVHVCKITPIRFNKVACVDLFLGAIMHVKWLVKFLWSVFLSWIILFIWIR